MRQRFLGLVVPSDVAGALGMKYSWLSRYLWQKPSNERYQEFELGKKNGGTRTILAPKPPYRAMQRRLLQMLEATYEPKGVVHGFIRGRSILSNAIPHVRRRYVLNIDLRTSFLRSTSVVFAVCS